MSQQFGCHSNVTRSQLSLKFLRHNNHTYHLFDCIRVKIEDTNDKRNDEKGSDELTFNMGVARIDNIFMEKSVMKLKVAWFYSSMDSDDKNRYNLDFETENELIFDSNYTDIIFANQIQERVNVVNNLKNCEKLSKKLQQAQSIFDKSKSKHVQNKNYQDLELKPMPFDEVYYCNKQVKFLSKQMIKESIQSKSPHLCQMTSVEFDLFYFVSFPHLLCMCKQSI